MKNKQFNLVCIHTGIVFRFSVLRADQLNAHLVFALEASGVMPHQKDGRERSENDTFYIIIMIPDSSGLEMLFTLRLNVTYDISEPFYPAAFSIKCFAFLNGMGRFLKSQLMYCMLAEALKSLSD